MGVFDSCGEIIKTNYNHSVPIIFSEDEDSIENVQKSGKKSNGVSPDKKKMQKKELIQNKDKSVKANESLKAASIRHWSSQSNLTQMSTITKKRQQYLEKTLYRTK